MCKDCFESEYSKFNSSIEFEKFTIEFDTKISKTIHFVSAKKSKTDSISIYKCNSCNEIWWLSEPDNHWRGYLLREKNAKKIIEKDEIKGKSLKYGCIIFFVFLLSIIIIELI